MSKSSVRSSFRPGFDNLESREVPTVGVVLDTYGDMVISGTNSRDVVEVRNYTDWQGVKWYQVNENINGVNKTVAAVQMSRVTGGDIIFKAYDGNDKFVNATGTRCTVYGGYGNDEIWGGSNHDYLDGGPGKDWIAGMAGNDRLLGGTGYDQLMGGDGNDDLNGGDDGIADYLYGGAGVDYFQVERVWNATKKAHVNIDLPDSYESIDKFYDYYS